MTAKIVLTIAESDTGPFDLYSDVTLYSSAFNTNVSKAELLAGFSTDTVPDLTSVIRVKSKGICNNYLDIVITTTTTTTLPL